MSTASAVYVPRFVAMRGVPRYPGAFSDFRPEGSHGQCHYRQLRRKRHRRCQTVTDTGRGKQRGD
ncbi:hypothetical protein CBM2626_A60341 [Cupriavidus taiwanensis]|uniref:Uncharacterized protein n=1 Tax=Cupriavidus taiwanensis TaxID=164546 RepID=A0A976G110_9BURK|nr:hypothetical protein CBM2615_A130172 [Cupriavidus taiwanensis]SOZ51209.1 hypothetical protein CBM2614_A130173 [Cupriavidus taiwanensis]SOZ53638.1 hypothetical protein CBM2613_A130171 [Cupriavidus taiwanensis]SPA00515.1 hypothetical protein CBM2626_A60341 [Cupriavidus taiwanensis]SPA04176.1 hypothetical protein CBM2625_A100174 [Cupriavidus taiwanensis]